MQVAMRLGPYWWKRLGEKNVGETEIRKWSIYIPIFLGIASVTSVISLFLMEMDIITADEITKTGSDLLILVVLAISATIIGTSIATIICLFVVGIAFVRALIATLRFRTIFRFLPPVTDEGHKAVQLAVDRVLSYFAIARAKEYSHEKELVESIRANGRAIAGCDNMNSFIEGPLQNIGTLITQLERKLCELEKSKKSAEKNYYKARNAARNPSLPIPFEVKKSFQDYFYLPKKREVKKQ